jgi:hypothetical protein
MNCTTWSRDGMRSRLVVLVIVLIAAVAVVFAVGRLASSSSGPTLQTHPCRRAELPT